MSSQICNPASRRKCLCCFQACADSTTTNLLVRVFSVLQALFPKYLEGQCYNEISSLGISTVKIAVIRSRFGCSNSSLCMISH